MSFGHLLLIAALATAAADLPMKPITSTPIHRLQRRLALNRTNKSMKRFKKSLSSECCHSQLLRQLPSPTQLYQTWFARRDIPYNNGSPGMTHPCLSVVKPTVSTSSVTTKQASLSERDDDDWWPGTKVKNKEKWRIIRYRRRVGYGSECYQRVRDAALDWEFHNNDMSTESVDCLKSSKEEGKVGQSRLNMGILRLAPPSSASLVECESRNSNMGNPFVPLPDSLNAHIRQVFSSPGRRPLATYTQKTLNLQSLINPIRRFVPTNIQRCLSRLSPSIYAVNPVAVVYDVIDQRGQGATYTSTAYGTLRGHWLCGEERVTVLLRDTPQYTNGIIDGLNGKSIRSVSVVDKGYEGQRISSGDTLFQDDDRYQPVEVEILSYSRAAPSIMGKIVWPFVGKMQDSFFQSELDALERSANARIQ